MACRTIFRTVFNSRNIFQVFMRAAVTTQARAHCKLRHLRHHIHMFDIAVAIRTLNPAVYMDAVIEIRIIGNTMHTLPRKRYALFIILRQFDNFRFVFSGNGMAIHTD